SSQGVNGLSRQNQGLIARSVAQVYENIRDKNPAFKILPDQVAHSIISATSLLKRTNLADVTEKAQSTAILEELGAGKTFAERAAELAVLQLLSQTGA